MPKRACLCSAETHKNTISSVEEGPLEEELLHKKHSELREKLHSINQGFERLRRVTHQGYDSTSGEAFLPSRSFTETDRNTNDSLRSHLEF